MTITGSRLHAQAASCEDYVRQTWDDEGTALLDAVIGSITEEISGMILGKPGNAY